MTENSRRSGGNEVAPALEHSYQFVLWLVPTVEKFPRSQKFLLGDRLQSHAYGILEDLTEATYDRNRVPILRRVNMRLQKMRIMFRIATDLKHLDRRRYEFAARSIDEIGRLVGGWIRADDAAKIR